MSNDEQAIRELVATWLAATKARDAETVLSLISDDVVFLQPGKPVMRKAEFVEQSRSQSGAGAPQFEATSDIQEIKVFGDWAFMWAKLTVVVTPRGGSPVTRCGHTLSVLRKEGGTWRLARDANLLA